MSFSKTRSAPSSSPVLSQGAGNHLLDDSGDSRHSDSDESGVFLPHSSSTLVTSSSFEEVFSSAEWAKPLEEPYTDRIYAPLSKNGGGIESARTVKMRLASCRTKDLSVLAQDTIQRPAELRNARGSSSSASLPSNLGRTPALGKCVPLSTLNCSRRPGNNPKNTHSEVEDRHTYPKCLDTHTAQVEFSSKLTHLLQQVVKNRKTEDPEKGHIQHLSFIAVTGPASPTSPLANSLGARSSCQSTSQQTSVSAYSADVSNSATVTSAVSSVLHLAGSSARSASESCSSSLSASCLSRLSRFDYVIQTPGHSAGECAFLHYSQANGVNEAVELIPCENTGEAIRSVPKIRSTFCTPPTQVSAPLAITLAPKKARHHIRIPTAGKISAQSRKRSHPDADLSESHHNTPTQHCPMDEYTRTCKTQDEDDMHVTVQTPNQETIPLAPAASDSVADKDANLPAKRQKLVMARSRSKLTMANSLETDLSIERAELVKCTMASFRRAVSLHSKADLQDNINESSKSIKPQPSDCISSPAKALHPSARSELLTTPSAPSTTAFVAQDEPYASTQPATPEPGPRCTKVVPMRSPFPILAPPPFEFIPRPPASNEEVAEQRLARLQEREATERLADGLPTPQLDVQGAVRKCDDKSPGSDEKMMWEAVEELSHENVDCEQQPADIIIAQDTMLALDIELGIEDEFRGDIIEWLLDFSPPDCPEKPFFCANLRAQLAECPDTRWHAAHLFTRYFLRIGVSPSSSPVATMKKAKVAAGSDDEIMDGPEALAWDFAIACLASAVKLHRDFLDPLFPVIVNEYIVVAPHIISYENLESAQRELLRAFSYALGSSIPGAYMEEIYNALPSLRSFIDTHGNWIVVKTETWEILYDSLSDHHYLRFPVYLLTGCSLVLAIVESMTLRLRVEYAATLQSIASGKTSRSQKSRRGGCECGKLRRRARKAVHTVEGDVRELLHVSPDVWQSCKTWLMKLLDTDPKHS